MAKKKAPKKKAVKKKKSTTAKKTSKKKKASKKKTAKRTAAPKKKATKAKSVKKKGAKKARVAKKKRKKRKPNAAFMKPLTPSPELAAVVGKNPLPRTQVIKKIWVYIKKHKLQDPRDRRMINADDKLLGLFGGAKQVSMFELTALVSKHLM
ncbi:MAG: hypothetical protein KAV82_04025 [Phycisphaerae bacterium]|nr:hypothetical protein [Phycisphaerae bacterium]